jgi:adenylyl- and sulfurtransferase ThiI
MLLTNNEIYKYARQLLRAFQDSNQRLPIKVNFYLQKNKNTLITLAQDIEKVRMEIISLYGILDEDGETYTVPPEKIADATKELNDLFDLEQEVQIYKINIDSLDNNFDLTTAQMEAIMFMID